MKKPQRLKEDFGNLSVLLILHNFCLLNYLAEAKKRLCLSFSDQTTDQCFILLFLYSWFTNLVLSYLFKFCRYFDRAVILIADMTVTICYKNRNQSSLTSSKRTGWQPRKIRWSFEHLWSLYKLYFSFLNRLFELLKKIKL